ncbi:cytochrome P450 [Gandjariella thermophila]|uniref:Cytochrome P450 n=1 Tax=Gandjariella thermophila TaxID=1931992 RepID=A0A4D4J8B0_9PSEU|nr:cytochrome P450 [Gandjariella thermophila]GDY31462.1 cytochrome P450 [Gandjariella thermophila]
MTTTSEPRTYPFGLPDRLNLDPRYARLRAEEPLIRVRLPYGEDAWLATRYQDVRTVLGDPRFSRAAVLDRDEPRTRPEPTSGGILSMDPPEHTRLRKLVAKAFTMRRVEALRPRAQEITDELIDQMIDHGPPADLVEEFALPLPVTVICELLGVPYEDRKDFRRWSDAALSTTALSREQVQEYLDNLHEYMAGLVARRRATPTDDLLGALVRARDEEDRLSEDELVRLGVGLLIAGHETTASQIPNFVYVLLTQPEHWQRLRAEPELVPRAVEELLRYIPLGAAAGFPRYATEDIELGGVLVRAGEPVLAVVASANRDESVFPDADTLDLRREVNPHVGFGHGVHHCLGAPLARMELQVALGSLVRRLRELRLATPEPELRWKTGMLVRGLESFPVSW